MNRRTAIRNGLIFSAGIAFLPSCLQNNKTSIALKNIAITAEQEKMLAQLSDLIIPKTNFIGAVDVKAHEFNLMMVDECYNPEKQKQFVDGLKQFDKMASEKYGKSFVDCDARQKNEWLTSIENKKDLPPDVTTFYKTTKQHTLQAFTSSQQYMVDIRKYKMVPGPIFKGCVPLKNKVA